MEMGLVATSIDYTGEIEQRFIFDDWFVIG